MKKMPSPRPRILGSPRLKNRDADKDRNPQSPAAPASRKAPDEPDCEIIKIEDDDEEQQPSRGSNGTVTIEVRREQPRERIGAVQFVKQCPMRLQEQFNSSLTQSVVAPISPSLALQFVPDTSVGGSTHARNIYSRQNVVMVLPVNTVAPQVFKAPTLCTLERIDNPREITRIQQVVATQKGSPGSPINESDTRTLKARSDSKQEFHELRKKILQQIFENDSTEKTSDSNARSLIPWKNKRESTGGASFFNNRAGSTGRDSLNVVKTSNSMPKGSGLKVGSMDVREGIVSASKNPTRTFRFVSRAGSLLRKPTGNVTLGHRSGVSRSKAPSSRVVSSDIQECFVSVSSNSVGKPYVAGRTVSDCPSKEPASSMGKQNGAYLKSKEPTAAKSLLGNNERPVPPLTMIGDKTRLYEEPSEAISVSEEPPDDVRLSENKKQSISSLKKPPEGVDKSVKEKLPISSPKELIVSIIPLDTKKASISPAQTEKPIADVIPPNTEKDSISSAQSEEPITVIPLDTEKDSISSAQSEEPIVNASPPNTEKDSISSTLSKEPIVNLIPLDTEKDSISSAPSKEPIEPSTPSQVTELSSQKDKPSSTPDRIDKNADSATPNGESIVANSRKPRCIACREKFSDRTELHRHATLAHRDVQIVFCDICSDAFLNDHELQEHRSTFCDRYRISEASTDDEDEDPSPNPKTEGSISDKQASPKRRKRSKQGCVPSEPSPGHSGSPKKRPRGRPPKAKVIDDSGGSPSLPKPRPISPDSSGVEKRKPQTKNKTVVVKYSYVEEAVIRHSATAAKFKSAEIKKLVVSVTRLEAPVLEKYLEKLSTRPVTVFGDEKPARRGNYGRPKGKLKVSPGQPKNIVNVRRGMRKRWPSMKLRRGHVNLRKTRQATANERRNNNDSDSEELPSNGSRSTPRAPSISDEFPASDYARNKKTARVEFASQIYTDSDEPLCSAKFVSKTDAKKTKKETAGSQKSLEEKSADRNDDSPDEAEDVAAFARSDVVTDDRKIIRKLTSRSSAASVAALTTSRTLRASTNSREGESSTVSTLIIRDSSAREEKSSTRSDASARKASTRGLDDTDDDEAAKNGESFLDDGSESERARPSARSSDSRESKASSLSHIPPRKTYLPSKRNSKVSKKPAQESRDAQSNAAKVQDLCHMCEEYSAKLLATQFGGKKTRRTSLACPLCDMHFITIFYLEKHIARKHLHCKSEPQCRRSTSAVDPRLDRETEVKLGLERRRCTTKFSEENDLEDVMEHHEKSTPHKNISKTLCFQTDDEAEDSEEASTKILRRDRSDKGGCSRSTKRRRTPKTRFSKPRGTKKGQSLRTVVESIDLSKNPDSSTEDIPALQCWVCDSRFDEVSEYDSHMREVHEISKSRKSMRSVKSDRTASPNNEILVNEGSSSADEEVAPTPRLNARDQIKADREYVLKQLLSDDSMDGFEEFDDTSREVTVELVGANVDGTSGKKVIGRMSAAHTCRVCFKEFNRTQDLLMHSLSHETESTEDEAMPSKSVRTEISPPRFSQELFADPSTNDYGMDVESEPANERKTDGNQSRCEAANEDCPIGDDLFADNGGLEESDDFANAHVYNNGAGEKVVIGEKRKAATYKEKPGTSVDRKASNFAKKSRCEKSLPAVPEVPRPSDERHCTLKEFLDTEKGLANADGTNVNDRVPIECGKCNRQFPTQAALNEHLFFLHDDSLKDTVLTDVLKTEQKSVRRWRCGACRQDFKQLQGYSRHRYKMHGDESMVHVCENCSKILTTVTMVNVHICTDVASYNCRTCDKTFSTGMSLRLHNTEKHMETGEPNVCKPCNKRFLTKSMLMRHENSRHQFLRPYRPRKRSPVMMATQRVVADDEEESLDRTIESSENCTLYSDDGEDEGMDFGFEAGEAAGKKYRSTLVRNPKFTGLKGQRGRSGKRSGDHSNSSDEPNLRDFGRRATVKKSKDTTTYIDESEIYQCSLCQLYCLTKVALDMHVEKIHSGIRKVCQLCRKMYVEGGLIRHVIDEHLSPCDTYRVQNDSIWNDRKDIKERDTELLVRILGMKRFMSMWDYQISEESAKGSSINCPTCAMNFPTASMYRFHFLMHHDSMCVLCNIEFKSGEDAAKHKKEEHRSPACYIWFVDRILKDVTAMKDYQKVMERSFIEMISRDSAESDEENGDSFDGPLETKETTFTGDYAENIVVKVESAEETELDEKPTLSEDSKVKLENAEEEEEDDKKLILVVTDEDLDKYNIGKRYPNIWGLASQISSTCEKLTPRDVKEMLEAYFEN